MAFFTPENPDQIKVYVVMCLLHLYSVKLVWLVLVSQCSLVTDAIKKKQRYYLLCYVLSCRPHYLHGRSLPHSSH